MKKDSFYCSSTVSIRGAGNKASRDFISSLSTVLEIGWSRYQLARLETDFFYRFQFVKLVEQVASLARLGLSDEEKEKLSSQFAEIISFVEQLSEVDTSDVKHVAIHDSDENNLRSDVILPCLEQGEALANAPAEDGEFFIVPKVIAEE